MKQNQEDKPSRRKFLSLGFLSGAVLLTQPAEAMSSITDEDEKVTMMTADGKLVEVSKKILGQASVGEKASNTHLLNWTDSAHKNKQG